MKGFCSPGSSSSCNNSDTKVLHHFQVHSHFHLAKGQKENTEKTAHFLKAPEEVVCITSNDNQYSHTHIQTCARLENIFSHWLDSHSIHFSHFFPPKPSWIIILARLVRRKARIGIQIYIILENGLSLYAWKKIECLS